MPSGAKKRKALKKKKEQEAFGAGPSNKGSNGHGNEEHGSQDEGESDGNLSSPGSQGNGEVWTRDPSPSPLSGLKKDIIKEKTNVPQGQEATCEDFTALESGTCHEEKNGVDKQPPNTFSENVTHNTGKEASDESGGTLEIAPADDSVKPMDSSVSEDVISNKNGQAESSADSDSVQHKANESQEKPRLEEAKEGNVPETSQVPECSEEKSLLPSGPPVTRTSWFSCCGLFDVMAGSER